MAVTPNLNLYLPDGEDYVAVLRDISDNLEKIDDEFDSVHVLRGSTQYLTSWEVYYTHVGDICTFICRFTPSVDIESSVGDINNSGLPNPRTIDFLCIYPATRVLAAWNLSDIQNRFGGIKNVGSESARIRACGQFDRGVSYSFGGSYLT